MDGQGTDDSVRNSEAVTVSRDRALMSALVPGLGQLAQRRFGAAAIQFGTAVTYLVSAMGLGGRRALFFAVAWNVWSILDAHRHEAD